MCIRDRHDSCFGPQTCLHPPVAPSSDDPPLTPLSCERTAAQWSDANLTSRSRERTAAHSFDATLTPQPNLYTAASLADVNPATSTMRQRMVGDAPQLPSLSSNDLMMLHQLFRGSASRRTKDSTTLHLPSRLRLGPALSRPWTGAVAARSAPDVCLGLRSPAHRSCPRRCGSHEPRRLQQVG